MTLGPFTEEVCRHAIIRFRAYASVSWWVEIHPREPELRLRVRRGTDPPDETGVSRSTMTATWAIAAPSIQGTLDSGEVIDCALEDIVEKLDL